MTGDAQTNEDVDDDRKKAMSKRFANVGSDSEDSPSQSSQAEQTPQTQQTPQTDQTSQTPQTDQSQQTEETSGTSRGSVTDEYRSITMYVPDDLVEEVGLTFDELKPAVKRATGKTIEKNRDYYPMLLEKGIENISKEDFEDDES